MSSLVPTDYAATLESIKRLVHEARYIAQRRVNTELLRLYWQIGATIIERQKTAPWGSKVLSRLSADLRAEFPGAKGFSPANLEYMRRFAEAWPDPDAIGQRPVGQLPWGHVIELLEKLDDAGLRDWYSAKDIAHGWSLHHDRPLTAAGRPWLSPDTTTTTSARDDRPPRGRRPYGDNGLRQRPALSTTRPTSQTRIPLLTGNGPNYRAAQHSGRHALRHGHDDQTV